MSHSWPLETIWHPLQEPALSFLLPVERYLVTSIISAAKVIGQLRAEFLWNGRVLNKHTIFPITDFLLQLFFGDLLHDLPSIPSRQTYPHPGRISHPSVITRSKRETIANIMNRSRIPIPEQSLEFYPLADIGAWKRYCTHPV